MSYCSLADFKAYRGIATATTTDDTLITTLLAAAQAMIDRHCHRTFEASADATKHFDGVENVWGPGRRTLWLGGADLCAITSVTNGDDTAVAPTDYVTEPRNSTPYYALTLKASKGIVWTYEDDPENAIAIVGKWAYSVTAPADIAHACKRLAAYLYDQKDNAADLDRPMVINGNTTVLPARMPADVKDILAPYVRIV